MCRICEPYATARPIPAASVREKHKDTANDSAKGIPLGAALVIRNAGGSAREALRSLTLSQQFLGTDEVHVIKHTDCGMQSLKDDVAREVLEKNLGPEAGKECQHMDFLTFEDLDGEVKRDVEFLKASSLIRAQGGISGWVYDVNEGKVRKVV